ncbi:MAG: gamma-glutamyl-gamma-aminobutyrate hydrolase family protein [Nitrososphaera sp.]|nr:gamma-glutamyl-gamma-aminobutyrate hydrolase family protein [Nitrososphaera sp.]
MSDKGGTLWKIYGSSNRFDSFFKDTRSTLSYVTFSPKPGDAVLFHGGQDIWPGLYGETPIKQCHTKNILIRDQAEIRIMEECLERNIPMIGICRGAQLMCVFAGGSLFQHLNNHTNNNHGLVTSDNQQIPHAPGDHHQIMRPGVGNTCVWTPLAWTKDRISTETMAGPEAPVPEDYEVDWELEVVYFDAIRGLAIQPHPEWGIGETMRPFNNYVDDLIRKYIL